MVADIHVTLTTREAVAVLSVLQKARLTDGDRRSEVASAEDKVADAIRAAQESRR